MQVDINNIFNSDEDKVQYALGTMKAYLIKFRNYYTSHDCGEYGGIIAIDHASALIKFLKFHPEKVQDNLIRVLLCQ